RGDDAEAKVFAQARDRGGYLADLHRGGDACREQERDVAPAGTLIDQRSNGGKPLQAEGAAFYTRSSGGGPPLCPTPACGSGGCPRRGILGVRLRPSGRGPRSSA